MGYFFSKILFRRAVGACIAAGSSVYRIPVFGRRGLIPDGSAGCSHTEISDLCPAAFVHQYIARFDILMDDTTIVRNLQAPGDLDGYIENGIQAFQFFPDDPIVE